MKKTEAYLQAQMLAQDLAYTLEHPRAVGMVSYAEQGTHCVRVHVFIKDEPLSQGKKVVSVEHDTKLNEITAFTSDEFHVDVQEKIMQFAKHLDTPIRFYK